MWLSSPLYQEKMERAAAKAWDKKEASEHRVQAQRENVTSGVYADKVFPKPEKRSHHKKKPVPEVAMRSATSGAGAGIEAYFNTQRP